MIACYCRISTHEQKVDSQKAAITKWLQGNGIRLNDVHWFEDTETGASNQRKSDAVIIYTSTTYASTEPKYSSNGNLTALSA